MLMPKRTKYRRPHRLSYEGRSKAGRTIDFGEYGLVAESGNYVSNRQIEAARIAMTRYMKRGGNVWIRIFRSCQFQGMYVSTQLKPPSFNFLKRSGHKG